MRDLTAEEMAHLNTMTKCKVVIFDINRKKIGTMIMMKDIFLNLLNSYADDEKLLLIPKVTIKDIDDKEIFGQLYINKDMIGVITMDEIG